MARPDWLLPPPAVDGPRIAFLAFADTTRKQVDGGSYPHEGSQVVRIEAGRLAGEEAAAPAGGVGFNMVAQEDGLTYTIVQFDPFPSGGSPGNPGCSSA